MPKQILIVDDDRDLSRMLRATLELFDRTYKIVEVPSGEEAMLEVHSNNFNLVVADILLPGMDGMELVRRLRRNDPTVQVIIISGNASGHDEASAKALNPVAYFSKPLNTDAFIAAVQKALGEEPRPAPKQQEVMAYSPSLADRLSALRRDLGCLAVYLADLDAQVVARAGDVSAFNVETLIRHIEVAFSASLTVSHLLGGGVAQNMHFFDGDDYDVYVLNVGQSYMLVMLYAGHVGARQLGQVSRYGRQAADDMLNALADRVAPKPAEPAKPKPATGRLVPQTIELVSPDLPEPIVLETTADFILEPEPAPEPVDALNIQFETLDAAAGDINHADLDSFWDETSSEGETAATSGNALSFDQALKLGLVPKDDNK
jgi:CheY-like chemotaxis protein